MIMILEPGVLTVGMEKDYNLKTKIETNTLSIWRYHQSESPWSNQKVREAVEYSIDREAIATGLGHGFWKAPYQVPARDGTPYNPNFSLGRKYDLAKAKALLAEAGYPNGFKTTIIVAPFSGGRDVMVAVQSYLLKLNIQTEFLYPDFGTYIGAYYAGPPKIRQ
jgi:peptide/nickel transport system substrate-binding protein